MSWLGSFWRFVRPSTVGLGTDNEGRIVPIYRCPNEIPKLVGSGSMWCEKQIRHDGPHQSGPTTWTTIEGAT